MYFSLTTDVICSYLINNLKCVRSIAMIYMFYCRFGYCPPGQFQNSELSHYNEKIFLFFIISRKWANTFLAWWQLYIDTSRCWKENTWITWSHMHILHLCRSIHFKISPHYIDKKAIQSSIIFLSYLYLQISSI